MIDREWARQFAEEWIEAWNSHDMDRIMSHYADEFEMSSPYIVELMNEPSGALKPKAQVRAYWEKALALRPDLRFEFIEALVGVESITLYYRNQAGRRTAEVLIFNDQKQVVRGIAHYSEE